LKIEIVFVLFVLVVYGCENAKQIPTHDMGYEFDYKNLDHENHDRSIDQNLLQQIKGIDELTDPEVICSFNSSFGKDVFKVYLVESKTAGINVNTLLVTDHLSESIVDYYKFNTDSVFLGLLYDRSEPAKDKGLVFKLISKEANENGIITSFDKSVNLKGKFEESQVMISNKYTFQLLDTIMKYSGSYFYAVDSFKIALELKDGIKKGNYAFNLSLQTPNNCRIVYTNLKGILEDKRYFLDSIPEKSILLSNDILKMNLELNQERCGIIEYQTFNLKKE